MKSMYIYVGLLKKSSMGLIEPLKKLNYRRIELGPGDLILNDNCIKNSVEIIFPQAKNNWGLVTHFGIWDSLQKGHLLAVGNLIEEKFIKKNEIVQFDIDNMEISIEIIGV